MQRCIDSSEKIPVAWYTKTYKHFLPSNCCRITTIPPQLSYNDKYLLMVSPCCHGYLDWQWHLYPWCIALPLPWSDLVLKRHDLLQYCRWWLKLLQWSCGSLGGGGDGGGVILCCRSLHWHLAVKKLPSRSGLMCSISDIAFKNHEQNSCRAMCAIHGIML